MVIGTTAKTAKRHVLASVCALVMYCGDVGAQCMTVFPVPMTPWPTEIRFSPLNPIAGEPVQMELGPLTLFLYSNGAVTQQGSDIVVTGQVSYFGGVPPPPHLINLNIGSYPAGSYQVRLQLRYNTTSCTEIVTPLLVGPAPPPTPVPTLSRPWWLAMLTAGVLAAALVGRRRRNR